jgi:hypothetical protein
MKRLLLFSLLALLQFQASSQIKLSSERDRDSNILIYAENSDIIPYTVAIEFKNLSNLLPSGGMTTFAVAGPGRTQVAKLKKENPNQSADNYNYTYRYQKGNIRAKSKEDVPYLVPVSQGVNVRVLPMTNIENTIRNEIVNEGYVGMSFRFDSPTTICAPRKGIVSAIKIDEEVEGQSLSYSALDNYIEIYHEDGTFSRIMVLKAGSAKVNLGDWVYPGDPIAESAGEKYNTGPHVRMVQRRLVRKEDELNLENVEIKLYDQERGAIPITEGTNIHVTHPEELVQKEMSKREKKKFASR